LGNFNIQTDIGIDFDFLNGAISRRNRLLPKKIRRIYYLAFPLSPSSGAATIRSKIIGTLESQVLNFVLNTKNISTEDFSWSLLISILVIIFELSFFNRTTMQIL